MSNHSSQFHMNTYADISKPNYHVDYYYDTFGGKLKVVSDFDSRLMSIDELETLNDIIDAVNKVYRNQYKTKLLHMTLDSVHLYGNCNNDNDIAVIYRCGCERFEIRYCSPCSNWFVSYHILCNIDGDSEFESINQINYLQLNSDLTAENVVEWLFNTMSMIDY